MCSNPASPLQFPLPHHLLLPPFKHPSPSSSLPPPTTTLPPLLIPSFELPLLSPCSLLFSLLPTHFVFSSLHPILIPPSLPPLLSLFSLFLSISLLPTPLRFSLPSPNQPYIPSRAKLSTLLSTPLPSRKTLSTLPSAPILSFSTQKEAIVQSLREFIIHRHVVSSLRSWLNRLTGEQQERETLRVRVSEGRREDIRLRCGTVYFRVTFISRYKFCIFSALV